MNSPVVMIRVDLPTLDKKYKDTFVYFFISAENGQRLHPWWNQLFEFLLALDRQPDGFHPDGEEMETARMTGRTREEFLALLQTAPPSEPARHHTLRVALRRLPNDDSDLPVRYFGPSPTPQEPT